MAFVCHMLAFQHLHPTWLWRCSGFGALHRTPMSSQDNTEWPTDGERLNYVCNPRSLMEGTETLCPHATILNHRWLSGTRSLLLSGKPDEGMHLFPFYTRMHGDWLRYAKSTCQYSLAFSLKVRDDWGFQINSLCRHDIMSPFPPSRNEGYIHNRDILFGNIIWYYIKYWYLKNKH